ncbi:glyoxylate/hydroxypyruvate reductase A [Pelagibacterium sp. H642]|uniref:2-hydroxyacid dehydrogenase n=1 Tax=Pelagibacterium sp. H642 TaxID=1881069 RepID=UPI0028166E56|nr:glyoxylate/hydroxypyruvate reductase A [Pelagibacterium sp. H642]WMT91761.1 glyoxylate/hydroxypyruvate reductase A [Pelagibacterium sp. H642]
MALLLHLTGIDESGWARGFKEALPGYRVLTRAEQYDPAEIEYVFAWRPAPNAFEGMSNLKAILSLGAGVDALMAHPALPDVPVVRFVDDELTHCMSDYVISQATMHQRLFTRYAADQKAKRWRQYYPPASHEITVGIMGLGVLGTDAALKLKAIGFSVTGWSRTAKQIEGVKLFAGNDELDDFLAATDILVCLLPLTEETRGILNMKTFKKLRRDGLTGGPVLINAARGGHQKETDIVAALKDGILAAASLDVFEVEPLPVTSPLWELDNCFITPHIAAISNERSGVNYFSRMILEHRDGKPLRNVVDRDRGY